MKHIHFIGIAGRGMSAIARVLLEDGYTVSGSDKAASALSQALEEAGAKVTIGHAAENVTGAELVVRSSAVRDDNPEVVEARARGIPVLKRSDYLGQLMEKRTAIAVAGSHGKSTTAAMVAEALVAAGRDPSYIFGGVSRNLGTNGHSGKGKEFVIEADEFDYMFLGLKPEIAVVTNVEYDHPDCFATREIYDQAFADFVQQLRPGGTLIVCAEDAKALTLKKYLPQSCTCFTYGLLTSVDYQAANILPNELGGYTFDVLFHGQKITSISMQILGDYNILNALASMAVCHYLSVSDAIAAQALTDYRGTERRLEVLGVAQGITIINDYAHHPTQIRTALTAARRHYPNNRIWAVWQPDGFSRTIALEDEFCQAFDSVDFAIITEVYIRREVVNYSSAHLVAKMTHPGAKFIPALDDATHYLVENLEPGDVMVLIATANADKISSDVLNILKEGEQK
jgi:UDP-N-acetylmuramate--alanine ligase